MKQKPFDSWIIKTATKNAKCVRLASDYKYFRIGACIFTKNKILVNGANVNKTSPMQERYNHYRPFDTRHMKNCCHAEISALQKLRRLYPNLSPSELGIMVYRETADGKLALARPCPACEKALRDYGINNIYYSGKNKMVYEEYK